MRKGSAFVTESGGVRIEVQGGPWMEFDDPLDGLAMAEVLKKACHEALGWNGEHHERT